MSTKVFTSLYNFFIFNSSFGPKEGEEAKKILFYHPELADIDTKIKAVGLCEAVIKFASTFNPDKSCQAIHTQKTRQVFLQPEPDFWMVLTATVPNQQKTKEKHIYIEYYGEEVQDHVLNSVLSMSYKMFRLFMGTFEEILQRNNNEVECLNRRLSHFFKQYLQSIRLHQVDLLDVFHGMLFLPLERHAFLKIKCFLNLIESSFPQIKYTCFLYNDQLVWSGLEQEDMQVLYKYLTTSMIPSYLEPDVSTGRSSSPSRPSNGSTHQYAKFMTGFTEGGGGTQRIPKVHIYARGNEVCHLVVYCALSATVCLLVDSEHSLTPEFFRELDSAMGGPLTTLASDVADLYAKAVQVASSESGARYLYMYFNHMNLAQKSTVHPDFKRTGNTAISAESMRLLSDFNLDLSKLDDSGEIMGKTTNDCWVVGRLADRREFYAVVPIKNASIIEVSDELKKLNIAHFQNLFVLE